jgi:hypothetical protein
MANNIRTAKQLEQIVSGVNRKGCPQMVGRDEDGFVDPRATTYQVASFHRNFDGAVSGEVCVDLFQSTDREDRGGTVLRLEIRRPDCAFIPHAVLTPTGVELHLAGETEAIVVLAALRAVLALPELALQERDL